MMSTPPPAGAETTTRMARLGNSAASCATAGPASRAPAQAMAVSRVRILNQLLAAVMVARRAEPASTAPPASRLELGIPIEIVEPAVVQVVRREQPSVAVQVMHAWLERHLRRPHVRLGRRHVALPQVARRAGGDNVVPNSMTP